MAQRTATAQQILEIRTQAAAGVLDTKQWADAIGCSVETVRRYARGDSARHLTGQRWGQVGLPTASNGPEPSEDDIAESLRRLTAAIPPKREGVDDLLDQLTKRGAENDEPRE